MSLKKKPSSFATNVQVLIAIADIIAIAFGYTMPVAGVMHTLTQMGN